MSLLRVASIRFAAAIVLAGCVSTGFAAAAAEPAGGAPPQLPWQRGPGTMPVGDVAEIALGEDFLSLDRAGTQRFLELTQNPSGGNEVAVVAPAADDASWFLVFEFDAIGYVRDDEKDELDADAMLAQMRESNERANQERERRGWPQMRIVRWHEAPHYDAKTNDLTWAIVGESEGHEIVNKLVKLLGRRGVMTVTLVADPAELAAVSAQADALLGGYQFRSGHTYAEFLEGTDSVADVGLKALIIGGAGAALVKSGLLGKLWKVIVFGVLALGGAVRRLFGGGAKESAGTPS